MENKINELFNNSLFVEELKTKVTTKEISDLFKKYGINVSVEAVQKMLNEINVSSNCEVSEEELDGVTGGGVILTYGAVILAGYVTGRLIVKCFS